MDKAEARQKAIDHLTKIVADCQEALSAHDVWQDYSPQDRAKSLALFQETRDVASRLLTNLQDDQPIAKQDWRRVMSPEAQWAEIYKVLHRGAPD